MSLPNGTTTMYLPIAGSAGASLWGTDVRALRTSADATADTTSICDHGTASSRRTVDPFSTSSADGTENAFGFAIDPGTGAAGMGSNATQKRRMLAGNHVATLRLSNSATLGGSGTVHMFAFRVGNAGSGRTRTQLGTSDTAVSFGALGAISTVTCTLALPEVVFDNDETIQYSFEITGPGQAVTGATSTFRTGTDGGVAIKLDFPELRTIVEMTGNVAAGAVSAAAITGKVLPVLGNVAAGAVSASGVLGAIKQTTGNVAAGAVSASASMAAVKAATGNVAAGAVSASAALASVKGMTGAVTIGGGGGGTTVITPLFVFDDG